MKYNYKRPFPELFFPHIISSVVFLFFTGTREAAFVYALSAATISHTIARACTSGDLRLCTCGPIPAEILEPGYRWGGCADNLHYGLIMGSKFADAPMKMKRAGSHANKLMHLHNSEVGRQVSNITENRFCLDMNRKNVKTTYFFLSFFPGIKRSTGDEM